MRIAKAVHMDLELNQLEGVSGNCLIGTIGLRDRFLPYFANDHIIFAHFIFNSELIRIN